MTAAAKTFPYIVNWILIFKTLHPLIAAALFSNFCIAQKLEIDLVVEKLIKDRLEAGEVGRKHRQDKIREIFNDAGCTAEDQAVDKNSGNVICTLPGESNSAIVVGAHFDFVDRGKGIVDDWSGTSMLPSLYQALKSRPRKHTYVFVAFAAEERGLIGSSLYVKKLTPDRKADLRAFINLECLGLTPPKIWLSRADRGLAERLLEVAKTFQIPMQAVNVDKVGDDDTRPFIASKLPVLTIHSLTQETFRIIHSERDKMQAIHFDDYYSTYRLVAFYLAYLDVKLE